MKYLDSAAVKANGFIFVSGQLGANTGSGHLVSSSVEKQTRKSLKNLKAIIKKAGSSLDKVVKTTVLLSDIEDMKKVNEIYVEFFKNAGVTELPARASFAVKDLPFGAKVEIEAVAMA